MLRKLFAPRSSSTPSPVALPTDLRVYAVGDVHGRLDLLDALLDQIAFDEERRQACATLLIFLGDLIDRGPASAGVIERLRDLAERRRTCRFLLGNHEEVLLKVLDGDLEALAFFTRIGGKETILSYGVPEAAYRDADYPELLELLRARIPEAHVAFLRSFEDMIVLGDYAFVHAGVRPDQDLAQQRTSDLRWIRKEFLTHRGALEKMVVHGHTISDDVEEKAHRIGLDTGAFSSGRLSAMGFEGTARWTLQTSA